MPYVPCLHTGESILKIGYVTGQFFYCSTTDSLHLLGPEGKQCVDSYICVPECGFSITILHNKKYNGVGNRLKRELFLRNIPVKPFDCRA